MLIQCPPVYSGQIKGADSEKDTPKAWKSTIGPKNLIFCLKIVQKQGYKNWENGRFASK